MRALSIVLIALLLVSPGPALAAAPESGGVPSVAPAPPAKSRPPSAEEPALSRAEIRAATAALTVAGYAPGPVDGDWDEPDAAALRDYRADWELPQTGDLTPDLLLRLLREHPETEPRWAETETGCRVWNRYPQARETVTWTGECEGGATSGEGLLTWTSVLRGETRVETYEGERRDGREHGEGVYLAADGSRYTGRWRDGLKHGDGIYVSPEGHVYVGEYRDGLRHGRGSYVRTEGASYEGEWKAGVQDGRGVAVWPDGSRYEGRLVDGKPQGAGTLTFTDGNVYSGEWSAGCFADGFRGATAGVTLAACGWE